MNTFIFENYEFLPAKKTARFLYSFDSGLQCEETVRFELADEGYDQAALDRALELAFFLIGVSYYKLFPSAGVIVKKGSLDEWQSRFLNHAYQEGLSQFAYENGLTRRDLPHFRATTARQPAGASYAGKGVLALQSGGKDSILTAQLLDRKKIVFDSLYITSGQTYPRLLDTIGGRLALARRQLDRAALKSGQRAGGLDGHIPVTYIVTALGLVQAILINKHMVLTSVGHEGEEPHAWINDLPVNHQWSKTWQAEMLMAAYVSRYIAPEIRVGSPLRGYSELRIAEMFTETAWQAYGQSFSSCNQANYRQGHDNSRLSWCGDCPKCANFYLLFAPFLDFRELRNIFGGRDLLTSPDLQTTFKGLLGVDGVMKPFECVGETAELRLAYHMAQARGGYGQLSFAVPVSNYDYRQTFPAQALI